MMQVRRGWIVAIEFSDHAEGGKQPYRFVVYGRVVGISRSEIVVDSWEYKSRKLKYDSSNVQRYTIVRGAIHNITRLVPKD